MYVVVIAWNKCALEVYDKLEEFILQLISVSCYVSSVYFMKHFRIWMRSRKLDGFIFMTRKYYKQKFKTTLTCSVLLFCSGYIIVTISIFKLLNTTCILHSGSKQSVLTGGFWYLSVLKFHLYVEYKITNYLFFMHQL